MESCCLCFSRLTDNLSRKTVSIVVTVRSYCNGRITNVIVNSNTNVYHYVVVQTFIYMLMYTILCYCCTVEIAGGIVLTWSFAKHSAVGR